MSSLELWLTGASILVLLCLSGFFSGTETAITAASRARMHQLEKAGDRRAPVAGKLIDIRERLIGAILLGNNLVNILASALTTSALIAIFGDAAVAYATIIMTVLVVVFSEVLPKTWAISNPDRFALAVAPIARAVVVIFGPVTAAVQVFVRWLLRRLGVDVDENSGISPHEEIRGTVDLQHMQGGLHKAERDRLGGLLDLAELEVSDIMKHRTKMQMLNADEPAATVVDQALASPYTRLPLWRGEPENIVGILHAKDLLRALHAAEGEVDALDIMTIAKPPWFVPDATNLHDQLNAFLKRKSHFALVVDEYGEVMGLVTLEDIIEEIVGEISDEHDIVVEGVRPQPDGTLLVDGGVTIRDLNRALDWTLPDDEATTAAGLVIHEARMIPEEKQAFTFHGVRFVVEKKDRNRITLLRVQQVPQQEA
ncbi:HlyC/CorC family transporter [Amorphus orientalis]|uniref:Mg2+/Co2+ transporter CorB n=1 Tax=Amorphus orientalis TaxID=649198 RepID=A0AAE3VR17_9HYPH|nr:HlyC/CorC family transporter [Amorphus orientalis]MDQ0316591.1 Mg2+/Co2+ transporter CorB [Amorphus orientalis]